MLCSFHIGALQPHDERQLKVDRSARIHYAVGNRGAVDDASKDIDKDSFNFVILADNPERLLDLVLLDAAAHVEKVSRFATVQLNRRGRSNNPSQIVSQHLSTAKDIVYLNYIHRRHCKTRSVHQAADVAVHL